MKTSLTFLLMLFAVTALAANPAFQDFNTNQFGVAGNKVVFKSGALLTNPVVSSGALTGNLSGGTNLPGSGLQASSVNSNRFDAATIAMFGGGGGDQVWTNDLGVIQPTGVGANTNQISIAPDGTLRIREEQSGWTGLTMQGEYTDFIEGNSLGVYVEQRFETSIDAVAQLFTYIDNSPYRQAALFLTSGQSAQNGINVNSFEDGISIVGTVANQVRFSLSPAVSASTTPHIFDTSLNHTSGNLLEIKNNGVNKFVVAWDGALTLEKTNAAPAGFTVGTTVPVVWFSVTNGTTQYLIPGYAP